MLKIVNKTLMMSLLCLILIGQSMASSVMVYNMVSMNENMTMMDHSKMLMEATNDSTQTPSVNDDSCCAQKCQCFASGCSTTFVFSKIVSIPLLMEIPAKIISTSQIMPTQALTSLYRPPIVS